MLNVIKGSPAGEVILECERMGVRLVPADDGSIELHGNAVAAIALRPHIEEHKETIYRALVAFKYAVAPLRADGIN